MNPKDRRRLERWALYLSLILAGVSVLFSVLYQSQMLYTAVKGALTFLLMFVICEIFIVAWDKSSVREDEDIVPTMDVLEGLEEQGIKVTYNPLPGQINMNAMALPDEETQVKAVRQMMEGEETAQDQP